MVQDIGGYKLITLSTPEVWQHFIPSLSVWAEGMFSMMSCTKLICSGRGSVGDLMTLE